MNETRNSTPLFVIAAIIVACFALLIAIVFAGSSLEETTDRWNAKLNVLVWALAISMVTIAASFPIRQWRRKDDVGERHYTHDGTKVIKELHYGLPPQQRQAQVLADPFAFPAMTRAAYAAGAAGATGAGTALPAEQHYTPIPTDGYAEWSDEEATKLPQVSPLPEDVPAPAGWDGEIVQ